MALSNTLTIDFFIFGLAGLSWICNPSTDTETSVKVMSDWNFSQETKWKQKFSINGEKEVGNLLKTGTIVDNLHTRCIACVYSVFENFFV